MKIQSGLSSFVGMFVALFGVSLSAMSGASSGALGATESPEVRNAILGEPKQMTFMGPRSGEGYFSYDSKLLIFQSEREPENRQVNVDNVHILQLRLLFDRVSHPFACE